ncbi:hypothetical protein GCM10010149_37080 [Nonomuraea roseoviolacea subsp. roseoviolacea]
MTSLPRNTVHAIGCVRRGCTRQTLTGSMRTSGDPLIMPIGRVDSRQVVTSRRMSVTTPLHEEHQELLPHVEALRTVAEAAEGDHDTL